MNGELAIQTERLGKQYALGVPRFGTALTASVWRILRRSEGHAGDHGSPLKWVLRDVSVDIRRGETVGLIGANGAGKSTLLKILARIVHPTEGVARIRGRVGSLLEVGTGFHAELTGRENIYLSGALLGMPRSAIRHHLDEIVGFAEIGAFLDTPVKHYSSGMYLRLGFAVAAYLRPEVLLVDEVLAVGDLAFQRKCLGKMGEVAESGRTIVFVSHNLAAVSRLCGRAIWLHEGRARLFGETRQVIEEYLAEIAPTEAERSWPEEQQPGDHSLRLEAIHTTAGAMVTQDQPFEVRLRYRVLKPLPDCNVGFELRAGDGSTVLTSLDSDHGGTAGRPTPPGRFEAICRVPGRLLNEGRYSITPIGGVPFVSLAFRVEDALAVEVGPALPAQGASARLPVRRPGVIAPLFDWSTTEL